jgi:hypothetical protein
VPRGEDRRLDDPVTKRNRHRDIVPKAVIAAKPVAIRLG